MRIQPDLLTQPYTAVQVRRVATRLGELGGFLLNDRAAKFSMAAATRPSLPRVVGGCWPVLAVRNPAWQQYLLPAFVLPLQWQRSLTDDQRLPPAMLALADRVRRHTFNSDHSGAGFGISYVEPHRPWPDLRDFSPQFIEADSCYASLAMGLRSATSGFPADPVVWASAIWNDRFTSVDLLEYKLETARRWGCRYFFVAPEQTVTETAEQSHDIVVLQLAAIKSPRPSDALSGCFARALLEPNQNDWQECRRFHADIRELSQELATDFYDRVLFKHITKRCRESIRTPQGSPVGDVLTHLVTIATKQPQPVAIIAGTLGISHVLVLHTLEPMNMAKDAEAVREQVLKAVPHCNVHIQAFTYDPTTAQFPADFVGSLHNGIKKFLQGVPDRQVVFDIDRGLTMHKVALLSGIIPNDSCIVSLYHGMLQGRGNRIEHGTEQVFLWRSGDGLNGPLKTTS